MEDFSQGLEVSEHLVASLAGGGSLEFTYHWGHSPI